MKRQPSLKRHLIELSMAVRQAWTHVALYSGEVPIRLKELASVRSFRMTHNATLMASILAIRWLDDFFAGYGRKGVFLFFGPTACSPLFSNRKDKQLVNERAMHPSEAEATFGPTDWSDLFEHYLPIIDKRFFETIEHVRAEMPHLLSIEVLEQVAETKVMIRTFETSLSFNLGIFKAEKVNCRQ